MLAVDWLKPNGLFAAEMSEEGPSREWIVMIGWKQGDLIAFYWVFGTGGMLCFRFFRQLAWGAGDLLAFDWLVGWGGDLVPLNWLKPNDTLAAEMLKRPLT